MASAPVLPRALRATIPPPRLRKGDTIAIVAPSACAPWPLTAGIKFFEEHGLKVKVGRSCSSEPGYIGRGIELRADDVNQMARDPDVRGLFTLIGGSSASEILPLIDYDAFAKDPKVVMGFSDNCALLCALNALTGLVTFYGENVLWGLAERRKQTLAGFPRMLMEGKPFGIVQREKARTAWLPGKASGRVIAGNLFTIRGLLGTPYQPHFDSALLCWEEVRETVDDLNVILNHFRLAGALDALAGMVVGHLEKIDHREYGLTPRQIVQRNAEKSGFPVLKIVEFGHWRSSQILPLGVRATMDADEGVFTIDEPAVS